MNLPSPRPGKRPGQKYKSLLVLQYLLKNADDENAVTMKDILSHLSKYGIESDRRSVYRDIHDLVELLNTELQEEDRIPERERLGYEIVFTRKPTKNSPQGGYLVTQRPYEFDELRLLTECVNKRSFSFGKSGPQPAQHHQPPLQPGTSQAAEYGKPGCQSWENNQQVCHCLHYDHQPGSAPRAPNFFQISILFLQQYVFTGRAPPGHNYRGQSLQNPYQ